MTDLTAEIDENAQRFHEKWKADVDSNFAFLSGSEKIIDSYRRITAIQALRVNVLSRKHSAECVQFYAEAQNDALTSQVLASCGAWRSALQALRSCIENALCCLYYMEHPVELRLWAADRFRIGFSELVSYFNSHPDLNGIASSAHGLDDLKLEYATLSKAVHASAPHFRMTDTVKDISILSGDKIQLNKWSTRERKVIELVSSLTVCLHRDDLAGTKNTATRSVLMYAIPKSRRQALRALGVFIS